MNATKAVREESGQALVELSMCVLLLCVLIFGIIDFGRAIYDVQVMKNLAGEGSSIASRALRGNTAADTANVVANYAGADLAMSSNGCVIVTIVTNEGGGPPATLAITDQAYVCGISAKSKIGCLMGTGGCGSDVPSLPASAKTALQYEPQGSFLGVTEIYYNYSAITPVGGWLGGGNVLPSQFYTVAFY
ncbi:MAG TPA: TadE/TadG family type IV pilus assembly protein [Terriglobales bacterium]|nr:TadE/TadG family type IV pilus assembly protein [Terriglobales bacterium]